MNDQTPANEKKLFQELAAAAFHCAVHQIQILPLAGDASYRLYFRLHLPAPCAVPTAILMRMQPQGKNSPAEEIGKDPAGFELPFINIERFLSYAGLPVPNIYAYDEAHRLLLLEDVGAETLYDRLQNPSAAAQKMAWYRQALDHLAAMQAAPRDPGCVAFARRFEASLFQWEFEHFVEWCLEDRLGRKWPAERRGALLALFQPLAEELAKAPTTFCHRDYHSKNLMMRGEQLAIIDFQDALTAPPQYDLASLLRDSYMPFAAAERETLLAYYEERRGLRGAAQAENRHLFDLAALQRNMKAAGRFQFIYRVKGKPTHLPYINPTLRLIQDNLAQNDRFAALRQQLAGAIADLLALPEQP